MNKKIVEEIKKTYRLNNLSHKKRKKEDFEDQYNPLKVYAFLRFGLGIPRPKSQELAEWYRDCFYNIAIQEYHNEKTKNRLEDNL